jgi:hypothetical protein
MSLLTIPPPPGPSALDVWRERWQRKGELLVTLGVTGGITWLAAALPTQSQTHVSIWPPLAVFIPIAVCGIYVLLATEIRSLPLFGRNRAARQAQIASDANLNVQVMPSADARDVASALRTLGHSLDEIAQTLSRLESEGKDSGE